MILVLSREEAECFKRELSINTQEELDSLLDSVFKDASEFFVGEMLPGGEIRFEGKEVFMMNLFTMMRDKITYIAGVKTAGLGIIKTGMNLVNDIKRDYAKAIELSKTSVHNERVIINDMDSATLAPRPTRSLWNVLNQQKKQRSARNEF